MSDKLKAYQVGENDIVAAHNEKEAIEILCEYNGCISVDDFDSSDVTEQSFDLKIQGEEGDFLKTLGKIMAKTVKAEYIVGWE